MDFKVFVLAREAREHWGIKNSLKIKYGIPSNSSAIVFIEIVTSYSKNDYISKTIPLLQKSKSDRESETSIT